MMTCDVPNCDNANFRMEIILWRISKWRPCPLVQITYSSSTHHAWVSQSRRRRWSCFLVIGKLSEPYPPYIDQYVVVWCLPCCALIDTTECLELVKRLRALMLNLLPMQVEISSINDPTSRVITPQVVTAFKAAAGDFTEAVCISKGCRILLFRSQIFLSFLTAFYVLVRNLCGMRIITLLILERIRGEVRLPDTS